LSQTFASYFEERYDRLSEGALTDFVDREDGRLLFGGRVDLNALARRYGAPLEVVYCPLITAQVTRMRGYAEAARAATGYHGQFLYAYATKANFAAEAVETALAAGAHYETSAAADVQIAHRLWRQGILPANRLICCNGSKEANYLAAICRMRLDGCDTVLPVLDDLDELQVLLDCPAPLLLGVRERAAGNRDGTHPGNDRFGLTADEIAQAADQIASSAHQLVLYHAMVGSQIEDAAHFLQTLRPSVEAYCRLRQRVPTLRYFNFGGGMPTSAYRVDFGFDYGAFLRELLALIKDVCASHGVPTPDLVGEFGRYTVASHSLYLFEVGKVKSGAEDEPAWHLINGSLMVSLPDSVLVPEQQFVVLPLDDWDAPVIEARLAGRRTCDSDDIFPRPGQAPLMLPQTGAGAIIAIFGVGAYQQMISGRGGAHHCLSPEARRLIIREVDGELVVREIAQQSLQTITGLLGYEPEGITLPAALPPLRERAPALPTTRRGAPWRRRARTRAALASEG
jgi:arginine decarboxylase